MTLKHSIARLNPLKIATSRSIAHSSLRFFFCENTVNPPCSHTCKLFTHFFFKFISLHAYLSLSGFVKKYTAKWPNCENIMCVTGSKRTLEIECEKRGKCSGFSFPSGKSNGGGCLKNCEGGEFGGYGSGSHDYWVKNYPGIVYIFT